MHSPMAMKEKMKEEQAPSVEMILRSAPSAGEAGVAVKGGSGCRSQPALPLSRGKGMWRPAAAKPC